VSDPSPLQPEPKAQDSPQDELPDYPGFLRTLRGAYISHADFLAFIGRAARLRGYTGDDAPRQWLRDNRLPTRLDSMTPRDTSRALFLAHRVLVAHQPDIGRPHGGAAGSPAGPGGANPAACPACGGTRFWVHVGGGPPKCARCHPAPSPELVARTLDRQEDPHETR
jgi:hypothetical protein